MKINKKFALSLALTGALALAACGPQEDKGTNNGGNQTEGNNNKTEQVEQGEKLEGSVAIDGSSTVAPIMKRSSEEYAVVQPDVKVSVGVSGTGGGFENLLQVKLIFLTLLVQLKIKKFKD